MKRLILLLFLPSLALATGQKYQHKDRLVDDEFANVYHALGSPNFTYGRASTMTVTQLNVSSIAVTGQINASTITVTQLNGSSITLTGSLTAPGVSFGKVKQIKQCTTKTYFSTTSTSFVSSSLACSITPTLATSSITIAAVTTMRTTNSAGGSNDSGIYTLDRSGTNLGDATYGLGNIALNSTTNAALLQPENTLVIAYLDWPNTTSSITYTLKVRKGVSGSNAAEVNSQGSTEAMILTEYAP